MQFISQSKLTRLHIEYLVLESKDSFLNNDISRDDGRDVIAGLTQKRKFLPPRYFYDSKGSQLFEQICELPEYYPTRTEASILQQYAQELAKTTGACQLVELGSGSSTKTRFLFTAYQNQGYPLYYTPIDVSGSILEESSVSLLKDYPSLHIHGLVGTYKEALKQLPSSPVDKRMVIFLGSSLGNFSPSESDRFFTQITEVLRSGDYFLLGIDLQKLIDTLETAYNDSQGVTAAFNLNVLEHLNRRFQGNFQLDNFKHWAFYDRAQHQIEMHLVSQLDRAVRLNALNLNLELAVGETIRTEISRKFDLQQMQSYLAARGLNQIQAWTDSDRWFGLILCQKS
jgi:dimethylhistidine N-methyltransferase